MLRRLIARKNVKLIPFVAFSPLHRLSERRRKSTSQTWNKETYMCRWKRNKDSLCNGGGEYQLRCRYLSHRYFR